MQQEPGQDGGGQAVPGAAGPTVRKADTGAQVINLRAMISDLESNPDARKRT